MSSAPIRIFLVDDNVLFCESVVAVLNKQKDLQVVGQCRSVGEARPLLSKSKPELVVLEIHLAERAEQIGLVNRVVKAEELQSEALALGQKLAAGPTFALGMTKVQIYSEGTMALPAAIEAEAQAQALCMLTDDFTEGYRAFQEKRPPQFQGR